MSGHLFERFVVDPAADSAFSNTAILSAMLRFEAALASAQARSGVIPEPAAAAIRRHAGTLALDADRLVRDGAHAGSLAIPFVKALIAHVASQDPQAARHVHFGATSQDVLDTALALCTRDAVAQLIESQAKAIAGAATLATRFATAPMLARSFLQPAGITTFGFKAAQWAHSLARSLARVQATASGALAVSFGGAIGNLSAQGTAGGAVRAELARELGLRDSGASWHTQRETWIALATDTALAAGTIGKIARDVALMAQAEVGEVAEAEAPGRGGSTAMPHKRNPVLTLHVIAAVHPIPGMIANLLAAMPQEHERALGTWQAELAQWPDVFVRAITAAQYLGELLGGLQVDAARCRRNIEALHGVIFAERLTEVFASALGKTEAQTLVAQLSQKATSEQRPLRDLALERMATDTRLASCNKAQVDKAFDLVDAARASAAAVEDLLRGVRAAN
ncbi:MAG: 3-carboxy-cis,cis-muconate cycloisomerase [Burkholderiales bacterium]|nr:3-carboxy-cis,cis-muconate cycloisomerase [Burkholderiales bacterium]